MTSTESRVGQEDCPNPETIERERRMQDEEIVRLRRMLAQIPSREDTTVYTAA